MKLDIDRQESEFLNKVIGDWEKNGLIDNNTAAKLRNSYEVKGFDWMRLAKYSFWIALICGAVAFGSLLINDSVIRWLQSLYNTPDIIISLGSAVLAAVLFYYGHWRKKKYPQNLFSNEAFMFTGVLFTACFVAYLGKTVDNGSHHFSILFLISVFIYGILAWQLQSRLIWLFMLISLGSWFGTETGYQTEWSHYFLGMNYPLRFVGFGLVLVGACHLLRKAKWLALFWETTYVVGMLYLFLSLWLLSIFGNYGDIEAWWNVKQISLFYWGIIAAAVAGAFLLYGLKNNDVIARQFGITFLVLSIYTKYFEYLWNHINAAVFFTILAASFWLIGSRAEKIWNLKASKPDKEELKTEG